LTAEGKNFERGRFPLVSIPAKTYPDGANAPLNQDHFPTIHPNP
jgi:hypothetical protein